MLIEFAADTETKTTPAVLPGAVDGGDVDHHTDASFVVGQLVGEGVNTAIGAEAEALGATVVYAPIFHRICPIFSAQPNAIVCFTP